MAAQAARRPGGTSAPRAPRAPVSGAPGAAQGPAPRHARPRAAGTAARRNRAAVAAAAAPKRGGPATVAPRRQPVTVRRAARSGLGATRRVTERRGYSGKRMLTAELLVGFLIVAVRAVGDYEVQADGTIKGKIGHPKGQYGPLPILAGLIVTFFLLSFLAAAGGTRARLAVIAGGVIDLALLMKSGTEFAKVSSTFGKLGHAQRPAGSWETSGTAWGEPISGTSSPNAPPPPGSAQQQQQANNPEIKMPASGKCPPGYHPEPGRPGWCSIINPIPPVGA